MKTKKYIVVRSNKEISLIAKEYKKIKGYQLNPKNTFDYPLYVNTMTIVKPVFIDKILKKKIKKRLDFYLQYIIDETEDDDASSLKEALDSVSRYKDTVEYKYRKFLDDKYIDLLLKKINLLEHELKSKITYKKPKKEVINKAYEEEIIEEKGKSR